MSDSLENKGDGPLAKDEKTVEDTENKSKGEENQSQLDTSNTSFTDENDAPKEKRVSLNLVFGAAFRALLVAVFLLWLGIFFIDPQYQFEKIFSLVVGTIFLIMAIFGFWAQPEDPRQH